MGRYLPDRWQVSSTRPPHLQAACGCTPANAIRQIPTLKQAMDQARTESVAGTGGVNQRLGRRGL